MKINRFAVSIGSVAGGIIGLAFGDTWTAVFAGALGAFFAGWVVALQVDWLKAAQILAEVIWEIFWGILWIFPRSVLLFIIRKTHQVFTAGRESLSKVNRAGVLESSVFWKRVMSLTAGQLFSGSSDISKAFYSLVLGLFLFYGGYLLGYVLMGSDGLVVKMCAFLIGAMSTLAFFGTALVILMVICACLYESWRECKGLPDDTASNSTKMSSLWHFTLGWVDGVAESEHNIWYALLDMIVLRFLNALRVIFYGLIILPAWGFFMLANGKTRMSALCAAVISWTHLLVVKDFLGGINPGNPNFWLSLAVAAVIGVLVGRKIYEVGNGTVFKARPLPKLVFAKQK